MCIAVSSTDEDAVLAGARAAREAPPTPHADDLEVYRTVLARTSHAIFVDPEMRGLLTDGQHIEVCSRAAVEALREAGEVRARGGWMNAPTEVP
jgi:hypothetical protein